MISKLIHIQKELKAPKSQRNSFGNYNYRNCEDILEAVKPLLAKYECALTISDSIEAVGSRYYVKATARVTDGRDSIEVTAYAREAETKKGMDDSQITGSTSSYARKYALNGLFAIDDTKDADTDEYTKKSQNSTTSQSKPQLEPSKQKEEPLVFKPIGKNEGLPELLKTIFAKSKDLGWQPEEVANVMKEKFKVAKSSDLNLSQAEELLKIIEG